MDHNARQFNAGNRGGIQKWNMDNSGFQLVDNHRGGSKSVRFADTDEIWLRGPSLTEHN